MTRALPAAATQVLVPNPDVTQEENLFYRYYAEASRMELGASKWGNVYRALLEDCRRLGIDFTDKRVLDVSGGPGLITRELSKVAGRAVVTEFDPVAVEAMRKELGVEAVRFAYDVDRLDSIVNGPFDVVLILASINFCTQLDDFVSSLRRICTDETFVYVTFAGPSLGACLRWQLDDYTYRVLYTPDAIRSAFVGGGFSLVDGRTEASFRYDAGWTGRHALIQRPIAWYYRARRPRTFDPNLHQEALVHVYRVAR